MPMKCDDVSELQPPTGLLFIHHMIHEHGEPRWNDIDRVNRRTRKETCHSVTLSSTYPTWTLLGANPFSQSLCSTTSGFRIALLILLKERYLKYSDRESFDYLMLIYHLCRSQWPRGLSRRSAAACLLGSRVRIPFGAWMFVCCVYRYMLCCSV
jgi:hypothetical protein